MKSNRNNTRKSRRLKSKKYKIQRKTRSRIRLDKINQEGGAGFHIDITDDEYYLYITDKLDDANHYLYKIDLRNKTFQINKMQDNEYYPLSQMPQRLRDIIFKASENEDRRIVFILNAHKINPVSPRATVAPTVVENQPGRFYEKYFPPNGQHPYYIAIDPPPVTVLPVTTGLPSISELPSPNALSSKSSSRKSSSSPREPSPRKQSPREPSPKALSSSKSSSRKSLASSRKPSSEALGRVTPLKVTEKLKAAIDFSRNRKLPPIEEIMRGSPYLLKLQRPSRGTIKTNKTTIKLQY